MNEPSGKDLLKSEQEPYKRGDQYCLGKSTCGGCDPNCPANTDKPKEARQTVTPLPEKDEFESIFPFKAMPQTIFGTIVVKWDDVWPFLGALRSAHIREMEDARKRIAVLELDFSQAKENAETNARLLNEALARIATVEAENNSVIALYLKKC